jgi:hypothetical protein
MYNNGIVKAYMPYGKSVLTVWEQYSKSVDGVWILYAISSLTIPKKVLRDAP